jgi:hypothetical protein
MPRATTRNARMEAKRKKAGEMREYMVTCEPAGVCDDELSSGFVNIVVARSLADAECRAEAQYLKNSMKSSLSVDQIAQELEKPYHKQPEWIQQARDGDDYFRDWVAIPFDEWKKRIKESKTLCFATGHAVCKHYDSDAVKKAKSPSEESEGEAGGDEEGDDSDDDDYDPDAQDDDGEDDDADEEEEAKPKEKKQAQKRPRTD